LSKTALKASAPKAAVIKFTRKFSKADEAAAIAAAHKAYFVDKEIATIAGTAGPHAAGASAPCREELTSLGTDLSRSSNFTSQCG
jgi:hypothetical protein